MKKLIIILFLFSFISAKPIHHRINDWFHDEGYVDKWTWTHAGMGSIKGLGVNLYIAWAVRNGYDYPSTFVLLAKNLGFALTWELLEYTYEGHLDWRKYQEMYDGKAVQNNGMDVLVDMLVFSIPLWDNVYWDIKRVSHDGFKLNIQWSF